MKYDALVRILDKIREEAPSHLKSGYVPQDENIEKINACRAKAFVHLFLKVSFGVLNFSERESYVTDGTNDGGIDGYYINEDNKTIYLIQAKFRTTERNFEAKEISLEEILAMDIDRILSGDKDSDQGVRYNGKILQFQDQISKIEDIARYSYRVVILANLRNINQANLKKLTGGYAAQVIDYEGSYDKLVFPVISGTYYTASDITIPIDLSNKSAGSKISYNVTTKYCECEITALFVPTIEIAKLMSKYKNAILKYNPRCYLEFDGKIVNSAIRDTILRENTNEFALYNNGITMLSDETYLNEKIGQKNKAQLRIKNPQIINGGQTSFTLSRIYEEQKSNAEKVFAEKEVLLKIITLINIDSHSKKLHFIESVSKATNQQTPVINADKFANEEIHIQMQKTMFQKFGILYERKRGEFADGAKYGYIDQKSIIERNQFLRIYYTANGIFDKGLQKRLFQKDNNQDINLSDDKAFERCFIGYLAYRELVKDYRSDQKIGKEVYAKIYVYCQFFANGSFNDVSQSLQANISTINTAWQEFLNIVKSKTRRGVSIQRDHATGVNKIRFNERKYYKSTELEKDVIEYFNNPDALKIEQPAELSVEV